MILANFYKDYLSLNLNKYINIGFDLEINKIIFYISIGVMIASIILNYRKYCMIVFIKRLLRYEAINENKAKSIAKLGVKKNLASCAMSLNRVSRIVSSTEKIEYTYKEYSELIKNRNYKEEKIDFSKDKLYIKEDGIDEARSIAEYNYPTPFSTILFCLFIFATSVCIMFIMPTILNFLSKFITK